MALKSLGFKSLIAPYNEYIGVTQVHGQLTENVHAVVTIIRSGFIVTLSHNMSMENFVTIHATGKVAGVTYRNVSPRTRTVLNQTIFEIAEFLENNHQGNLANSILSQIAF